MRIRLFISQTLPICQSHYKSKISPVHFIINHKCGPRQISNVCTCSARSGLNDQIKLLHRRSTLHSSHYGCTHTRLRKENADLQENPHTHNLAKRNHSSTFEYNHHSLTKRYNRPPFHLQYCLHQSTKALSELICAQIWYVPSWTTASEIGSPQWFPAHPCLQMRTHCTSSLEL